MPNNECDFLRWKFGRNWVLARRTKNIVRRCGPDVVCLSQKQYQAALDELAAWRGPQWRVAV